MKRTLLALTVLLFAACENAPVEPAAPDAQASSHGATVIRQQFTQSVVRFFPGTCLGEDLNAVGTRNVDVQWTLDPAGGAQIRGKSRFDVMFTGATTGRQWELRGVEPFHFTLRGALDVETFAGGSVAKPVNGTAPIFLMIGPFHLTVDAQGQVRVEFEQLRIVCPGNS